MSREQKFREAWKEDPKLKDWLMEVPGESAKAKCRVCPDKEYNAKYSVLIDHSNSKVHITNMEGFSDDLPGEMQTSGPGEEDPTPGVEEVVESEGTTALTVRQMRVGKVKIEGGEGGNWSKYSKRYKPQWEKLEVFANWLRRTPESLIDMGKPEAYCVLCQQCLRAHKSDLLAHAKSKKHKDAENRVTTDDGVTTMDARSFVESYVPDIEDQAKSDHTGEDSELPTKRTRGRPPKLITNKAAIVEQIAAEFEETMEKIKACEEELKSLKVKKARLEFEFEYYSNN